MGALSRGATSVLAGIGRFGGAGTAQVIGGAYDLLTPGKGRITVADYDKYVTKIKAEMDELDRKLVEFTNNDKSFVVTAEHLLRLASRAKELFESSQPYQKNKILRLLLANLTLNQKRLQLYLLKPFDGLVSNSTSENWLPGPDSNRQPRS